MIRKIVKFGGMVSAGVLYSSVALAQAAPISIPSVQFSMGGDAGPTQMASSVKLLLLLTVLSLAPAILISMTAFARIVIVFSFLRQAIGAQNVPGNQILVGLALFMTFFVMSPVIDRVRTEAYEPYVEQKLDQGAALKKAWVPLSEFMLRQTREKDLALFVSASGAAKPQNVSDIKVSQLVPAFMISELTTAFSMGFMVYIPFLVIDMVISSVLMAMGMMMLPPVMISLPFKIVLFVLVDGWNLIVGSLLKSFA